MHSQRSVTRLEFPTSHPSDGSFLKRYSLLLLDDPYYDGQGAFRLDIFLVNLWFPQWEDSSPFYVILGTFVTVAWALVGCLSMLLTLGATGMIVLVAAAAVCALYMVFILSN